MCYTPEILITTINSDLRRWLRIKMSLKWWVLSYNLGTLFFFPPERKSVYQNSFCPRKGSPNCAWKFKQVSSSQECNLKEIGTIKQARCSYLYEHDVKHHILMASVCSGLLSCMGDTPPPHKHFWMLSLIAIFSLSPRGYFSMDIATFFSFYLWIIFPNSVAQETRRLHFFFQVNHSERHELLSFSWYKLLALIWISLSLYFLFFHKREFVGMLERAQ